MAHALNLQETHEVAHALNLQETHEVAHALNLQETHEVAHALNLQETHEVAHALNLHRQHRPHTQTTFKVTVKNSHQSVDLPTTPSRHPTTVGGQQRTRRLPLIHAHTVYSTFFVSNSISLSINSVTFS